MKKLVALLAALAASAGSLVATGAFSAGTSAVASPAPTINASQAEQVALGWAARANDATPQTVVESETRGQAAAEMGAADPASAVEGAATPVYVVTMHGNFTLGDAPVPPGARAPSGHVLKVEVESDGAMGSLYLGGKE